MGNITFPADFIESRHPIISGATQWKPREEIETFISIVGGGKGLYGDGETSFEIMIGDDVHGWQTEEQINELISTILTT